MQLDRPDILERILRRRRPRVEAAQRATPEAELRRRAEGWERRGFTARLRAFAQPGRPAVIAELKQASPSRGVLRADFDVAALAAGYEQAGAAALSVLTEEDHFQGQLGYLRLAREATRLPILRKDFLYCDYQIWEAAAAGADAALLIAAMLDDAELGGLLATAREAGIEALCEVHNAEELRRVAAAGADWIGVNNRDLHTFAVDTGRAIELAAGMPAGALAVAESGLREGRDLAAMAAAGYAAALIGEQFMRAADPGAALADLLAATPRAGFAKICGITNLEDARGACAAGADAVGFVFAASPRRVTAEQARAMGAALPRAVLRVGVFADMPAAEIAAIAAACGLDAAQLHGGYAPDEGEALARRCPVWRAVAMPAGAAQAAAWAPFAQGFVLDTAVPGRHGGTGATFAWEEARALIGRLPAGARALVAGGLHPGNVAEAIRRSGARGVDASSGLEAAPGRKDAARMREWITAARVAFGTRTA